MPTVSVGERVYPNQGMVKPRDGLIRCKRLGFDPIFRIAEQLVQLDRDQRPVASDILVRRSKPARPVPGFVEHPAVQIPAKSFGQHLGHLRAPEPLGGLQDVFLLPVVQRALRVNVPGDQPSLLIRIQRGLPVLPVVTFRPIEN